MVELNFSSKLDQCSYIFSTAKNVSKKIGDVIRSMKFFYLGVALLLYISINLPYDYASAWNTVVMLCLCLVTTWNCQISYKSGYAALLVLRLLPLLNPWFILQDQPAQVFSIGIPSLDVHLNWLNWFLFFILEVGLFVILIHCMIVSVTIPRYYKNVYDNSFHCTARP